MPFFHYYYLYMKYVNIKFLERLTMYTAYIDGASRGNPGPSGIGVVIYKDNTPMVEISKYIGIQTNNIAEYSALLELLDNLIDRNILKIEAYSDSELIVNQINGKYKVRNMKLIKLYNEAKLKINKLEYFKFSHVKRESNSHADKLANIAIDKKGKI